LTIAATNGYRLFLRFFALGNLLFSGILFALTRPSLSTPLFEFPLLAVLHSLVVGTLIPLLLVRFGRDSSLFRMSALFVATGDLVLIAGFLLHPRSALPEEGGLMVTAGILMAGVMLVSGSWRFLYWIFLSAAAVMGILLGGVLARPTVDPIPFSMIAAHGVLGAGLGLFPLFWLRMQETIARKIPVLFFSGGIFLLLALVLQNTLVSGSMAIFVGGALLLAGAGIEREGQLLGLFCLSAVLVLRFSDVLLPGEVLSLLGVLLLGGCFWGYFRQRN